MAPADKRQQILNAASECLARYGYDKTTLDDIAGRIGLNKTSLYYYYRNKETIFSDVIVHEAKLFLEALQDKAIKTRGCQKQILTYLTERFRYYQHVVNLHHLSMETLRTIHPVFKAVYQTVRDREIDFIGKLLQDGMDRGEIKPGPASKIGRIILTLTDAIKLDLCEDSGPGGVPRTIDYAEVEKDVVFAVRLILKGLKNEPPKGKKA
jgi:AcrR family transcriptional regulator